MNWCCGFVSVNTYVVLIATLSRIGLAEFSFIKLTERADLLGPLREVGTSVGVLAISYRYNSVNLTLVIALITKGGIDLVNARAEVTITRYAFPFANDNAYTKLA